MSNKLLGWKVVEDHIYETFKIFQIRRSRRINPRTGNPFDFFLMKGLDWVNVIALTAASEVVLVQQYRHGAEALTFEIPGGCVEPGEDPVRSAARELREETGFEAQELQLLGVVFPNPAMQAMRCHCYLARGVVRTSPQALDSGEDISVIVKPLTEVEEMIRNGEISHSVVLSAFALLNLRLSGPE
jgi:8-oxo-dGTP pyrophosphatase MutT (NUDIX family)